MDIRELINTAGFSVPAAGGGYIYDRYVREELKEIHPKQFLPGSFAPYLWKLTVSYGCHPHGPEGGVIDQRTYLNIIAFDHAEVSE